MTYPKLLDPIVNLPRAQKMILGVVGLLIIAGAAYWFVLSANLERLGKLEAQEQKLQAEISQNRMIVAQITVFRRQATELERDLAVLAQKLPTEKEIPPLYRSLTDAASTAGLGISLFQPREAQVRDYYNEIPITFTAEGGYHDLAVFLDRMSGLPRVVTVGNWKLTGLNRTKAPLRADLTLETFTYRPIGSPPPPKPAHK